MVRRKHEVILLVNNAGVRKLEAKNLWMHASSAESRHHVGKANHRPLYPPTLELLNFNLFGLHRHPQA